MRLRVDQLESHLKRSLNPIYLVSGDEPLQLMECLDQIRKTARSQQYEERIVLNVDSGFDWNRLLEESASLSLFASQKIIELKLGTQKTGREGGKVLKQFAEQQAEGVLLLISMAKLDKSQQSGQWFKALEKTGVIIQVWPINAHELPDWLMQRCQQRGKRLDPAAAEFLSDRVEGNLMAANQEIERLCLLIEEQTIQMEDVLTSVMDNSRFDVFGLMDAAYQGDLARTRRMLEGLKSEGIDPMAIYGALLWDYRRLCKIAYDYQEQGNLENLFREHRIFMQDKKFAIKRVLQRHQTPSLQKLLANIIKVDRVIKSKQRLTAWSLILDFLAALASDEQQVLLN